MIDHKQILESQAFAVLNMQIDENVSELQHVCQELKFRVNQEPKNNFRVSIRVYEEGDTEVEIPFNISCIDTIRNYANDIIRIQEDINRLQVLKLRLLNDWDFTRGDDSTQIAIFGEGSAVRDLS